MVRSRKKYLCHFFIVSVLTVALFPHKIKCRFREPGGRVVTYSANPSTLFNPLSLDMEMHILLTVLHTILMELERRIFLNMKTSHPW